MAAATCCKTKGLGCLDVFNDKTSSDFAVGGGAGDKDDSTPSGAHVPDEGLTEVEAPAESVEKKHDESTSKKDATWVLPEPMSDNEGDCKPDEELYGGLCYKQCSVLTHGANPIRTSSWTCCESHPCTPFNQKGDVGLTLLCNGYDVGSDGRCPHAPGACPHNEELLGGVCFKKCSILTKGEFPYRSAAATCCKSDGIGCLNFYNDETSSAFDVGSGVDKKDPEEKKVTDNMRRQNFRLQK